MEKNYFKKEFLNLLVKKKIIQLMEKKEMLKEHL